MDDGVNLIDETIHSSFSDHLASNLLRLLWWYFKKSTELFESDIIVQFTGTQKIMFNDGSV